MKTEVDMLFKKEVFNLAERLILVMKKRKAIFSEEKVLKEQLRLLLGTKNQMTVDGLIVKRYTRRISYVNRDGLIKKIGKDLFDNFLYWSTFEVVSVRAKGE